MKKSTRVRIDELARLAISERVAAIRDVEPVPPPVFRGSAPLEGALGSRATGRGASLFPLVAAALVCCMALPALTLGRDAQLSRISAAAHRRGSVERCRVAALDILSLAASGQSVVTRR